MRTIVDIPDEQVKALDTLGARDSLSRAELVRRAVDLYLLEEKRKTSHEMIDDVFGFLKDCPEAFDGLDGLAWQEKMRAEWDDRDKMYGNWAMHDNPQSQPDFTVPKWVSPDKDGGK